MIVLRKMTKDEYHQFKAYSIKDYAKDLLKGQCLDEEQALREAKAEFEETLPQGLETPGQFLMTVQDATKEKNVGLIWFFYENENDTVWLCDFLIYEEERRKGYAKAALAEMERLAKADGCAESSLYVWDHNPVGHSLYQKCGYLMAKHAKGGAVMKKRL